MAYSNPSDVRVVGRYALYGVIAAGGMATVHYGRLLGPVGFSRTVAIKRLHAHFASDPEFVSMFLDEARLAARIRHPNVVTTLDVVATGGELFLVMEYVPGETLARLAKNVRDAGRPMPHRIVSSVISGVLHGLHAAHEAKDERGVPLGIVHRDVSPQNTHVGTDGVARLLDFGVAKAAGRIQTTREGQIKGKLAYMAPEQLRGAPVDRSSDIYAAGVMLWELITGQRLFQGENEGVVVARVLEGNIQPPSQVLMRAARSTFSERTYTQLQRLDACVLRAVHPDPKQRFATARDMALELEACVQPATLSQVGEWVEHNAAELLAQRAEKVSEIEVQSTTPAPFDRPDDVQKFMRSSDQNRTIGLPTQPQMVPTEASHAHTTALQLNAPSNPVTQPSTISVSASSALRTGAPPATSGNRWVVLGAAAVAFVVLLGLFGGALIFSHRKPSHTVASDNPAVPVTPSADPAATTAPPPMFEPPTPIVVANPATEPAPSTTGKNVPVVPTHRGNGNGGGHTTVPTSHPTASATVAPPVHDPCDPPTYIEEGIVKYKKGCLGK